VSINNTDFMRTGLVNARRLISLIVVLIPIEVIMSASLKNSSIELTRKE
jgi:hypothetical protein